MINGLTVPKAINFLGHPLCLFRNKLVRFTASTFPRLSYRKEGGSLPEWSSEQQSLKYTQKSFKTLGFVQLFFSLLLHIYIRSIKGRGYKQFMFKTYNRSQKV
jgi:hypothetical protein